MRVTRDVLVKRFELAVSAALEAGITEASRWHLETGSKLSTPCRITRTRSVQSSTAGSNHEAQITTSMALPIGLGAREMKIHSDTLTVDDLYDSLFAANDRGRVPDSIYFEKLEAAGSRKRLHGFEIQLASSEKVSGDNRRLTNSGTSGAGNLWAATYDEWGWIIAEIFKRDPSAIVGDYDGISDFTRRTSHSFTERQESAR